MNKFKILTNNKSLETMKRGNAINVKHFMSVTQNIAKSNISHCKGRSLDCLISVRTES